MVVGWAEHQACVLPAAVSGSGGHQAGALVRIFQTVSLAPWPPAGALAPGTGVGTDRVPGGHSMMGSGA